MPKGVYQKSKEHKRKLSEAITGNKHPNFGKHLSGKTRLKISMANKGKISPRKGIRMSEECKRKISLGNKGKTRKGHPFPEDKRLQFKEERKGIDNPMYGKHHSEKTRKKMGKSRKGKPCPWVTKALTGKPSGMLGKKHKPETIEKLKGKIAWNKGIPNINAIGEKNYNWKGGISKDKKRYDRIMKDLKRARIKGNGGTYTPEDWDNLKKEYGYMCPACGKAEPEIKLTADHIIPIAMGGSNYIENIQPLCKSCNCRKHTKNIKYEPCTINICA
ncbi:MAG: NUMOD3 domain-containing DNA-binding protein [Candidatus Omnitrophota bacterium]